MIKAKLIRLEIGKTLNEITKHLLALEYKQGHNYGVELIETRSLQIHGKFIEEIVTHENQVDPFGNVITNNIIRYSIFEFTIIELKSHQFLIKIDSPPRSLKSFTNALQKSLGFGVTLFNVELNIQALIPDLRNFSVEKKWILKKARISGVKLSPTSISKVEIYSQTDAYEDARASLDLENTTIERLWYEVRSLHVVNNFEISNSGLLIGDEADVLEVLPIITSKIMSQNS